MGLPTKGIYGPVCLLEVSADRWPPILAAGAFKCTEVRRAYTPVATVALSSVVLAERTPGDHAIRLTDFLAILVRSEHGHIATPTLKISTHYGVNHRLLPVRDAAGHRLTTRLENLFPEAVAV